MTTLQGVELGVLGPLQVRQGGVPVMIPGAKPRALLTMLGLRNGSVVPSETLIELLWGTDPPRTAAKALQTHISALRRALGDGFVLTEGGGWKLAEAAVDAATYMSAARRGRDAAAAGDSHQAVVLFEEALGLWRGIPELPDGRRGLSEKTRWLEGHSALVEDRADALLATGRAAEVIGDLEAAVAEAPLREKRWCQLMLALYRAGRQGEALGAYQRARSLLADELGVDPGPELRRLEAAIVAQDSSLDTPAAQQVSSVMRAVTFLLTDIEGSTAAWEADAAAMATALARHDELIEQVVTSRGGRLIKTRGEGDATFSVFDRPSAAAAAAIEMQEAIAREPWALAAPMRIRVALHTGEVELRDGDYFGRAVNRAARLRSLAAGGQILCSGAVAELVIDTLADDVSLADLGMQQLKNLARPEHVFELRLDADTSAPEPVATPFQRPALPAVLIGPGPFVGRGPEFEQLVSAWPIRATHAVLIAGEPGVGKTRLAGEWSQRAYQDGAVVLYGRCDEDLGAPYQPFAEALRALVPCVGAERLRGLRGVEALLPLVPGLPDVVADLAAPPRADPETERYALFDAVVALLEIASAAAPVVLILDDLHWAAKPTLLLLRHLLRFGDHARVQIVGTYRSTDLDRSHPLAAMLADLHRDGTASRLNLAGLDENDVTAYVAEAGYDDDELAHALASVTGGNPFFLIEALRHVDESGGVWDQSTLPQGVREAVSRRLSRLSVETNKALSAAAVVGSRFALDLVEHVVGDDLIDAFDEASKAGIVIEEAGGHYRFNHALVRQSLLAELASVRRMRLHQRIAVTLESQAGGDDDLLAELAHHYFECAWAGNASKAVEYCRRAADQAMARLAYEGAADLYGHALHALEEIDDELPDRDDQVATLLVARCEALLAAGDVTSAAGAVSQLQSATIDSARLAAWATCFDGQLSMLIHPERLDEVEAALRAAAEKLAGLDDAAGEANAHTVRAGCLARLGRIADCEIALDNALTAARRAREHRRVNAVLAGAPLAALWGPNPVPRAGGRCLDVVRLLRITTDSPAVEATSTRCQAVLEAFRGRAAAARRMIDSARRTVTELGLRHALCEVEQFAGIVELVAHEPGAAEPLFRKAYNGFRRMRLEADTAETAALLGRACLALGRDAEADELCSESEHLAGHALKASIAWRTLRAQLLSRTGEHDEARRMAESAVTLAERTDALVDHGDACLTLATVLGAAGDDGGARAAAGRAVDLYERKGAAALVEKAGHPLRAEPAVAASVVSETQTSELDNACARVIRRGATTLQRQEWDEFERLFATVGVVESRRKLTGGFIRDDYSAREARHFAESSSLRIHIRVDNIRGQRLALTTLEIATNDLSPAAPRDEMLQLFGLDEDGRIALQVSFDLDDMDAAIAELDATHARWEAETHRQSRRRQTPASRVCACINAYFESGDWTAVADTLADNIAQDDRRKVIGSGLRQGRDAVMAEISVTAAAVTSMTTDTIATRGEHLVLNRVRSAFRDDEPGAFGIDVLAVVEIDADERVSARTVFDFDDFRSAIAELDARYLTGAGAPYAHTWSVIAAAYNALNCRQAPPTTADWINVDHRVETAFGPGDLIDYFGAGKDFEQDINTYVQDVHSLNSDGAVITYAAHETSREGFDAEWRGIALLLVDGEMIRRCEVFDEIDLDAANARFEQLCRPVRQPENAASAMHERIEVFFAARDWDALSKLMADDCSSDDRRPALNSGTRSGRDALVAEIASLTEIGVRAMTSDVIATRGNHLALSRAQTWGSDRSPAAFHTDVLDVLEVDAEGKFSTRIVFDLDDFDSALAELDKRYLAGEAARHSQVWSAVTRGFAALNRRELFATTEDWVNIDHRRGTSIAPGEMTALLEVTRNLASDINYFVATVDRLNDAGAVVTHISRETTPGGFQAEWRVISVITFDGDLVNRCEVFDADDIDAALARFDQLVHRPPRRLENAASRMGERFLTHFAAGEWDAMAEMLADDFSNDDRRRVLGMGVRVGREGQVADMRVVADLWSSDVTPTVIATRGEHLVLDRLCFSRPGENAPAFFTEVLGILEIDSDGQLVAFVCFDLDDTSAAIAELDARYLAGEGAADAHTWRVVADCFAALSKHEIPSTTTDLASVDHRRVAAFAPGDLIRYLHAGWELNQYTTTYVEAIHRLNQLGAVVTHAANLTSHEGFEGQWRTIDILLIKDDLICRVEIFDETDLDAALAKFEELCLPAPQLENAASRALERYLAAYAAREWQVLPESLTEDFYIDDRRRVVNAGIRHGQEAEIQDMRAAAGVGMALTIRGMVATRGNDLALLRVEVVGHDVETVKYDVLQLVQMYKDRAKAAVVFDVDDFDAALTELDVRYLVGEASAYAVAWQTISDTYASVRRGELPALSPDCASVDHRRGAAFASGDLSEYTRAGWELDQTIRPHIVAVHRLSQLGAVVTYLAHGSSQVGFEAEWREVAISTVKDERVNCCELFDEADLDDALARFEELHQSARRLENAATRVNERLWTHFAVHDWDAMSVTLSADYAHDDRRRMVGAGAIHGREAGMRDMKAIADIAVHRSIEVIAIRGERLALTRSRFASLDPQPAAFVVEVLAVVEIDDHERIAGVVAFEPDDLDAAFAELDARYLAGEASPHAHAWSVISASYASISRHELYPTTPDWVNLDHRRPRIIEDGELNASLESLWKLVPDITFRVEAVHRLSDLGAVCSRVARGVSQDGFDAEWRGIEVQTVDGQLIDRCEIFDQSDLDIALARFDELNSTPRKSDSTASHVAQRFLDAFAARDWDAMAKLFADDYYNDDRRTVVNAGVRRGRGAAIEDLRIGVEVGLLTDIASPIIATRGDRLVLTRIQASGTDHAAIQLDALQVVELNADNQFAAVVIIDGEDMASATAELEARYIGGEANAHAQTWSVITGINAAFNRGELPEFDWINIDHRRGSPFASGELTAALRSFRDLTPQFRAHIETVHRLSDIGAVVTNESHGLSHEGADVEWRMIQVLIVERDRIARCEVFDETELDMALARFEELSSPQLQNAATDMTERYLANYVSGDFDAGAKMLADNFFQDDRRRVVGAGVRRGRDAQISDMRAITHLALMAVLSTPIALRGERLALARCAFSFGGHDSEATRIEVLGVTEIDTDGRIVAAISFDIDDLDAAVAELESRYLIGEAAPHADIWSVIAMGYAALNRHQIPPGVSSCVTLDHRVHNTFEKDDLTAYIRAGWDLTPDMKICVESVHRLDGLGAVVTHIAWGTSPDGFSAEWRMVQLLQVGGDRIHRCELFDETDLDAALARLHELHPQARGPQNAARRVAERFIASYTSGDWDAMAAMVTDDIVNDDRRRLVGSGIRQGRDAQMADVQAVAGLFATNVTSTVLATRGERLVLAHNCFADRERGPEASLTEALAILEITDDERIAAFVTFDVIDIDAALAELDARYLAGEAAAHAPSWSVIAQAFSSLNRREIPSTVGDFVDIDHRNLAPVGPGDLKAYLRAALNETAHNSIYVERVHRLTDIGAVVTHVASGTSAGGFDAEWRITDIFMVDGDLLCRCEMFDEADLDQALAKFDELSRGIPPGENPPRE